MYRHIKYTLALLGLLINLKGISQNLVTDGAISSNTNWNAQEAPWNSTTYQASYMAACGNNYVMEVDNASIPTQTINGFVASATYVMTFRYAYRSVGCGPSNNPTFLRIRFSDATTVLDYTLSIPNTQTAFTPFSYSFTNNASTTHTLQFTNPGNANTCGVIVDDISILRVSSPGGVGSSSLAYWVKAESIALPDGNDVYAWNSLAPTVITVTAPCTARPVFKTGRASAANNLVANYNPYVTFNGTTQYLSYDVARQTIVDAASGGNGISLFTVYQGGTIGRTVFGHRGANNSRIENKTDTLMCSDGGASGTNNNMQFSHNTRVNIAAFTGKHNGLTIDDLNGTNQALVSNSTDADYITIGVRKASTGGAFGRYFNGSISEIIAINGPLTSSQMHRIRSYLGIKYGVTLSDNSTTAGTNERSYEATDGTVYWNSTTNSGYNNNITGIGRDDACALNQTVSISTDADAGSTTGNAMLIMNNGVAFSSDISYLVAGHNGTAIINPIGPEITDVPSGIQSRLKRIWKFQKTGSGVANTATVAFDMTNFSPLTGTDLRLLVSNSAVFAGATAYTGTYSAPYFTVGLPTTGGVYFTLGSINYVNTPLPITLLNFTANPTNTDKVLVEWSTASETNNDRFEVERSLNGISFETVGSVKGAGTSQVNRSYSFVDAKPFSGSSYYRLKQIDTDGEVFYSGLVSVNLDSEELIYSLYPNPNKGEFTIAGNVNGAEVVMYNLLGQKVEYSISDRTATSILVNCGTLAKGVYFVNVRTAGDAKMHKLVIE